MKRFIAVLSGILVLPAYAEVAPFYYDAESEYDAGEMSGDVELDVDEIDATAVAAPVVSSASVNPRVVGSASTRAASRAVPSGTTAMANTRSASSRTSVASRTTSNVTQARTASGVATRSGAARVASRSARAGTTGANQIATTRRAMQNNGATTARASIVQTDTVNVPLYTGRVSSRASAVRARIPTITSTAGNVSTTTSAPVDATAAAAAMDELAQLTDFCKAQYTDCMDNFCNVLDDNQGRCSCSKNIKNYEKTEQALKEATEALKDVAQQIQYIGLTSDEIETLFTQTEAELEMQQTTDNTQLKNDLDKIRKLLVDVKGGTATSSDVDMSFDLSGLLDFSVDSTGFDLASLFGGTSTNTASISNQRGEQLYKTAASRCKKAVLESCQDQGVDISIISNAYDLEIDKQCVAYERQLTDTNEEMTQTVRNAKGVLQRARLLVAQNKNTYDLRGCLNALDSCMQDDFVCGTDYENCLDPTGKYIVNGEIVVGSMPGYIIPESGNVSGPSADYSENTLYGTWHYSGKYAWGSDNTEGDLAGYIKANVGTSPVTETDANMAKFLQHKIGYNDGTKNYGMCMSVLNKCQDITYDKGKYKPDNNVVREYLQRTLVQIKAAQDEILADYASNCISDVSSCLSANGYDSIANSTRANIAINACRSTITTCMSVNGDTTQTPNPDVMQQWVAGMVGGYEKTEEGLSEKDRCLSNGDAVISRNGKYCVIYGIETEAECKTITNNNGAIAYHSIPNNHTPESAVTGTSFEPGICFYMLPSVYNEEVQSCVAYGGALSGQEVTNMKCANIKSLSEQACKNIGGKMSAGVCEYSVASVLDGDIYCAKDLRGVCLAGMEVKDTKTGNCACKSGYVYESAYNCVPE